MANGSDEVRSLLKDVVISGSVIINKKKLLWLLGWAQDRESAWKDLMAHWKEIGEPDDGLFGIEIYQNIILTAKVAHTPEPVAKWARM